MSRGSTTVSSASSSSLVGSTPPTETTVSLRLSSGDELLVVLEAIDAAAVAAVLDRSEHLTLQHLVIGVLERRNRRTETADGTPGELGVGKLHDRDPLAPFEVDEAGLAEHPLGDTVERDVVLVAHAVDVLFRG